MEAVAPPRLWSRGGPRFFKMSTTACEAFSGMVSNSAKHRCRGAVERRGCPPSICELGFSSCELRLAQPGGFRGLLEQSAELACGHWLMIAAAGKQPALFPRNAGVMPGRPRLPPLPQQIEDPGPKHHVTILATFRLHDADDHLLAVDVARLAAAPLRWPAARSPQPATIRERQHRARLEARRQWSERA